MAQTSLLIGALGFTYAGFLFTPPLARVLLALAIVPAIDDLKKMPLGASQ
ncbi:MAG TPA: hypothetical protein VII58_09295 [Acidobacteriaceae bacterium]